MQIQVLYIILPEKKGNYGFCLECRIPGRDPPIDAHYKCKSGKCISAACEDKTQTRRSNPSTQDTAQAEDAFAERGTLLRDSFVVIDIRNKTLCLTPHCLQRLYCR
jgi:hypothetical protein